MYFEIFNNICHFADTPKRNVLQLNIKQIKYIWVFNYINDFKFRQISVQSNKYCKFKSNF